MNRVKLCRQSCWGAAALAICLMGTSSANAAFVTYNVSFTADTFQVGSGIDPAPVDPVIGSFTITLDPSVAVANETAGITLNTLNIALGSPLSYTFDPAAGVFPAGTLRVGGISAGSDVITFNPSTNDFWLYINDFTSTQDFQQLGYTQTSVSSDNLFFTLNQTGSVVATLVPEPSSLVLYGLGVVTLGICGLRRRRRN